MQETEAMNNYADAAAPRPMAQTITHECLQSIIPKSSKVSQTHHEEISSPLWGIVMLRRVHSAAAMEGYWVIDKDISLDESVDGTTTRSLLTCIAQIIPDKDMKERARINLYHRIPPENMYGDNTTLSPSGVIDVDDATRRVLHQCLDILSKNNTSPEHSDRRFVLTFGSLDRNLLPHVCAVLEQHAIYFRKDWSSPCGLWTLEETDTNNEPSNHQSDTSSGVSIQSLQIQDAELIDSRWEYKSNTSLTMIKEMITASNKYVGGSIGLLRNVGKEQKLVAWICRYLDGALGMLWSEPDYRRKGYAAMVLQAAVQDMQQRQNKTSGDVHQPIAYIVDNNSASQSLFIRIKWRRLCNADWIGFSSPKKHHN